MIAEPTSASVTFEQNVLGAMLLERSAFADAQPLDAYDFTVPAHGLIYGACSKLHASDKPIDPNTVAQQLSESGHLEAAGGLFALAGLVKNTVSAGNARTYGMALRQATLRRRLPELLAERGIGNAELLSRIQGELARLDVSAARPESPPLDLTPVSAWAKEPPPPPRDWVIENLVPSARVTSLMSNGGQGKTTIALQMGVHVALNRSLYGLNVAGGGVLGIYCEDELDELRRRVIAACQAEGANLADVDRFVAISRDGYDYVLATFQQDKMVLTDFYWTLDAALAVMKPRLLQLDVLADFFVGDYMNTSHARQFVRVALGGYCVRHGCAVMFLAHPSAAAIASGDGGGFSTAWNNAVRSRLYLRKPKSDDPDTALRRIMEVKKSNYGPTDISLPLIWDRGVYVPDGDPLTEGDGALRTPRVDTRAALSVMDFMRARATAGSAVVTFGSISEHLSKSAVMKADSSEAAVRKSVQRTLSELIKGGLLGKTNVPKGYKLLTDSGI